MFERRSFIPFVTAGYPDLETTREVVQRLAAAGAGLIEIGIPFSDPIADGPVIQQASFEALAHGYSISDYLEMVRAIRKTTRVPLIFMTYLNPVLRFGVERLDHEGAAAGLDGLLISDLTPEEGSAGLAVTRSIRQLKLVQLVAPTSTPERIERICAAATGFIYLVARTGVTGRQTRLGGAARELVNRIRDCCTLPVAVGFGIRSREDVEKVWEFADGAVVGTAIVRFMQENRERVDLPQRVAEYVQRQFLERTGG
ncbi:MAG: tryptophan synthase subunit alpha [Acidobacteriota bacterium]